MTIPVVSSQHELIHSGVVLDVNVLRAENVVEACIAHFERTGRPIVIPELALFELTKHPERWEATVRASLRLIARRPDAVVISRSSRPLGQVEEESGVPTMSVADRLQSAAFREVLRDLHGGGGADLDSMLQAMQQFREQLQYERHAADSLQTMRVLKSLGRPSFPRDVVAGIGNDLARGDRTSFRELLRQTLRLDQTRDAHVRRGVRTEYADKLMTAPCITYLFALAVGALGLGWIFEGGVDSATPGRVANDVLDIEYHLAAFWHGRLISRDARARRHFGDLSALGATWWPTHAQWFGRAESLEPDEALSGFLAR